MGIWSYADDEPASRDTGLVQCSRKGRCRYSAFRKTYHEIAEILTIDMPA